MDDFRLKALVEFHHLSFQYLVMTREAMMIYFVEMMMKVAGVVASVVKEEVETFVFVVAMEHQKLKGTKSVLLFSSE